MKMGNLTLFSVIEILFLQQDYRTVNFLIEGNQNDISNEIIQWASDSLIPITHFVVGELNTGRSRCEAPILNVVAPNYLNNGTSVDLVRNNIFPDDVTIVMMPSENYEEIEDIGMWMNLSAKVILLIPNLTMFYSTFENVSTSKIDLSPFDPSSGRTVVEKVFAPEYVSRQERNFSIFFQYSAPRSSVSAIGQQLYMLGPDGTLAEILVKWLKVNPIFSSNIATIFPDYKKWMDESVISPRMHYQFFFPKVLTKDALQIFDKDVADGMDIQLSSFSIHEDTTKNFKTENLYPHEKDCLVIMVPKQSKLDNFLQNITSDSDIQSIFIALIIFAIVRIIVQRTPFKQWIFIFLKTLGIFLNQDRIKNRTSVEVAWDINLRGFSVLATVALSVIIFKNVMSEEYSEIDTIDDLVASNLTIFAPDFLLNDESFLSNLKPSLHRRITFKSVSDIDSDVVQKRMFNNAYVYSDGRAEFLDMLLHSFISSAKSYKRSIRVMHEKLHCQLSAYRISKMSPLKMYVNDFILRFIENGLYDKHLEWIRQLNSDVFQVNKYKTTSTDGKDPVVLNIDLVFGILVLYMVGVTVSVLVFLLEMKV